MDKRLLELCCAEKEKFDAVEFKKVLQDETLGNVDISDEHGMTSLMHCAYHGYMEQCKHLLTRGADVNNYNQKDGYTALMFAAVAGQVQVVDLLLRAGANTSTVNKLGKTASSMAGFVGQHEAVQMITNFFSPSELDDFTKMDKHSHRPRLSPSLATPLHSLLITTHLHPVMLLLELQKEPALLDSAADVTSVLKTLALRLVNEQREGLAVKMHYLAYLTQLARDNGADRVVKKMLTFDERGKAVEMDLLLRQCLREFSHPHLPLLRQMIMSLANTDPGDQPTAYTLFVSVILGDKGAVATADACFTCGKTGQDKLKKCMRCQKVYYCSVQCQQLAWTKGNHNKLCKLWTTPTESSDKGNSS